MRSQGSRDEITLCTKVGSGGGPENIAKALSGSLDRLGTDHVDIYKMHAPDSVTPIAETLAAMTAEVDAGRVGSIGCSNYSAGQLREALDASAAGGYRRFEVIQPPYSLAHRDAEENLFPLCRREHIGVTSFSPLGAGFLAGKYTSDRATIPSGSRFDVIPGHIDIYFSEQPVANYRDTLAADSAMMSRFNTGLLERGILKGAQTTVHRRPDNLVLRVINW